MHKETSKGTSVSTVYKFVDVDGRIAKLLERGERIDDVVKQFKDLLVGIRQVKGNVFLYEGVNFIWRAIAGESGLTYFRSNSCIGVGDGADDPSPSQSGLTGTNKTYKQVDVGYPQITDNKIVFRASFGPDDANHCYTPDHEILTADGWKPIINVSEGEYVATIAPDGKIVYQPVVTKTVFHYRDYIYMIENRFISLAVTPNHKVYVRNEWWRRNGGGFDLLEVDELEKGAWEMSKSGRWDGASPKEFVVEGIDTKFHPWLKDPLYLPAKPFVKLLGYVLSEGYVTHSSVVISQSKKKHPDRYNEILELARECGFNPRESRRSEIWINDKRLAVFIKSVAYNGGSRATHKRVPRFVKELSSELIREFLDTYFKGDGSLGNGKTIQIYTTSQYMRDDLQELALKAGFCADYYEHTNPNSFSLRTKYVVSIKRRYCSPYAIYRHDDKRKSEIVKVPYDGLMVGIGVPEYHTLYVRRKGKAVWSGNSWQEWTVANGCGDQYVNINRRKENLGVKSSGSTWVLEVTLSII